MALAKVIALNESHQIARAEVLAQDPSRKKVSEALLEVHTKELLARTYVFVGGAQPTTAEWQSDSPRPRVGSKIIAMPGGDIHFHVPTLRLILEPASA